MSDKQTVMDLLQRLPDESKRLLNHRNVGDSNKFHMTAGFIVNQCFSVFCEEAVFRFFDLNYIATVESQRIRLEGATVFNVQKNFSRHVAIVRDMRQNVKFRQIELQFFTNKNLIQN